MHAVAVFVRFFVCRFVKFSSKMNNRLTSIDLYSTGTDPICSSNFTQLTTMLKSGDVVQLSCTIIYGAWRGVWPNWPIDAVMTWSMNGQPIPAGNATFTIGSSPTEITASSTLLINENFDATYKCETTFSQPGNSPPPAVANNAPDYYKTCNISRLSDFQRIFYISIKSN